MFKIMAQLLPQYRTFEGEGAWRNEPQEVDTAETMQEAEYLRLQYAIAYGNQWKVWIEEEKTC
jgi:hypothetical protein